MEILGFNLSLREEWNILWLLMWLVFSAALVVLAFNLPFWPEWAVMTIPLFFIPEGISIWKQRDSLPPLTHLIRHFLPNWLAFPLLYFLVGSIGARALDFGYPRNLHVGGLFAILGWLTDHFAVTYAEPDPYPSPGGSVTEQIEPRGLTL